MIDDLTIENKRLKQLLKNRRAQQESQDQDKLFEVRIHGLPSDKKRELEALLRNFAANLDVDCGPTSGLLSRPPAAPKCNVDSRFNGVATHHMPTDSGYASNSNSGQTSATPSKPGRPTTAVSRKSNEKTVQSYLHNIPNGLLPRQPPVMSERAKMLLVVRRLENLFTGKIAAPGEHSQPLQQQEVSRLAANAEMQVAAKPHREEGSREAHILPFDSEVNVERLDLFESSSNDSKSRLATKSEVSEKSTPEDINSASIGSLSPDQRPTRPLDLDVHRAQVAEENIEYLRHLGLTSPKLNAEADKDEGEGWIYLNLLISMAQLHTINVTPAFIRKSIKKLSAKFELSGDGRQVRWKGGSEPTELPAGTAPGSDTGEGNSAHETVSLRPNNTDKQSDRVGTSNTRISATPSEYQSSNRMTSRSSIQVQPFSVDAALHPSIPTSRAQPASSFDYKPILFPGKSLLRPKFSYLEDSTFSQSRLDNSSSADSSDTALGLADYTDAGPIVFYNSTLFCSDFSGDFSGDQAPPNMRRPKSETSECALGVSSTAQPDEIRDRDFCYFAEGAVTPISRQPFDAVAFDLPPIVHSYNAEQKLDDLPASGIGGVTPQDHFIIDVNIARTRSDMYGETIATLRQRGRQRFEYRVVAFSKTDLPPSELPPPSYIFLPFFSSSSSGVGEVWDSEDEEADSSIDKYASGPPVFLTRFSTEDSSASVGDDSSVDMLLTARAIDGSMKAVEQRELNRKCTPMDEEAVAGSLAATAGDGSEIDSGVESDVDDAGSSTDGDDDL